MRGRESSARCENTPLFLVVSFFTKAAGDEELVNAWNERELATIGLAISPL